MDLHIDDAPIRSRGALRGENAIARDFAYVRDPEDYLTMTLGPFRLHRRDAGVNYLAGSTNRPFVLTPRAELVPKTVKAN